MDIRPIAERNIQQQTVELSTTDLKFEDPALLPVIKNADFKQFEETPKSYCIVTSSVGAP